MKYIKKMYVAAIAVVLACGMCSTVVAQEMSTLKRFVVRQLADDVLAENKQAHIFESDLMKALSNDLLDAYDKLITDPKVRLTVEEDIKKENFPGVPFHKGIFFIIREKKERARASIIPSELTAEWIQNIPDYEVYKKAFQQFTKNLNADDFESGAFDPEGKKDIDTWRLKYNSVEKNLPGNINENLLWSKFYPSLSDDLRRQYKDKNNASRREAYNKYMATIKKPAASIVTPAISTTIYDWSDPETVNHIKTIASQNEFDAALKKFEDSLIIDKFECKWGDCTQDLMWGLNDAYDKIRSSFIGNPLLIESSVPSSFYEKYNFLREQAAQQRASLVRAATVSTATGADLWTFEAVAQRIKGIENIKTRDEWIKAYEQFIESLTSYPKPTEAFVEGSFFRQGIIKTSVSSPSAPRRIEKALESAKQKMIKENKISPKEEEDLGDKKSEKILEILNK